MVDPETAIREYILGEHEETITAVIRCADRVAESWNDEATVGETTFQATTDREEVVEPLSRELHESGLLPVFSTILAEAVSAAGFSMQATPVPAPPYVALTSRGPILRATVSAGRLVVSFHVFDVRRTTRTCYIQGTRDPRDVIMIELK
ncbi:hypothetical protein [Haladaptatus caseinilyticus]|uniref:hypothetical protein n=1 Tax=Haladaptatus caseinilyticus TaxID=2993314 RepID=UPI00224A8303|nr:hypothetical protein [Haladaptatus caseinilyticus]